MKSSWQLTAAASVMLWAAKGNRRVLLLLLNPVGALWSPAECSHASGLMKEKMEECTEADNHFLAGLCKDSPSPVRAA